VVCCYRTSGGGLAINTVKKNGVPNDERGDVARPRPCQKHGRVDKTSSVAAGRKGIKVLGD